MAMVDWLAWLADCLLRAQSGYYATIFYWYFIFGIEVRSVCARSKDTRLSRLPPALHVSPPEPDAVRIVLRELIPLPRILHPFPLMATFPDGQVRD
jgi:hypothetical protein